jgi:transposase-like protein
MAIKTKSDRKNYSPQFKEVAVKEAKEHGNV